MSPSLLRRPAPMVEGGDGGGAGRLPRRARSGVATRPREPPPGVKAVQDIAKRAWALPLPAHLLALGALLGMAAPFLHLGDTFTADEGLYAIQVRALEQGSWEYDYRPAVYDPDGSWFPLRNAAREDGSWFPYVHHPAYPLALLAATRVFGGTIGLYAWGLLGTLGVAAAAWSVAARVDARASRGAFWIAATGPVAINGFLVLAHAPSAALAGTAVLAALRAQRSPSWRWAAVLLGSVSAGALLRAEAVLFGLALAGAVALAPRWASDGRPAPRGRLLLASALLAVVAATVAAERAWIRGIVGGPYREGGVRGEDVATTVGSGGGVGDFVVGRLEGAWHSLLQGAHTTTAESVVVVVALTMVGFAAGAAVRRRPGWPRDVGVGLGAATALYGARWAMGTDQSVTGLLAAWPLALLGPVVVVGRRPRGRAVFLVMVVVLFGAAVVATQYRIGGGFEWGGRFFSPAAVPLAVLACLGLRDVVERLPGRRPVVVGLLVLLAALPLGTGLSVVRHVRPLLDDVADEVVAGGGSLVLTHSPALPPAAWRTYPEVGWMVVPPSAMDEAVSRIRRTSGARVDVVVDRSRAEDLRSAFPGFRDVTGRGTARLGWRALTLPAVRP